MPAAPALALFVQPPRASGYRLELGRERVVIGRSATSGVRLPEDPSLSRQHAEIAWDGDRLVVRDLGSRNGTFVNGRPVPQQGTEVRVGDTVSIGETLITVEPRRGAMVEFGAGGMPDATGTLILRMEDLLAPRAAAEAAPDEAADSKLLARFGRQVAMFEALNQASRISVERPVEELLTSILDGIFEMVPAERGAILIREGEGMTPVATRHRESHRATEPIHISRAITEMATRDQAAISTLDAQSDPRFAERASIKMSGIRSAVCAPLFTGKEVLGLLYVDTQVAERTFGWDDLTLISTLAVITAIKLENHRLLQAFLERERMARELDIAKEICDKLLPGAPPAVAGLELYARNVPCREIGGDYYEFLLVDGVLHVCIADVCGKSIPAALLMASLQASLRAYMDPSRSPSELCRKLNDILFRTTPANKFVTLFYGRLDPRTGRFTYTNAGHNPPLLVRSDGTVEELRDGGTICGMFEHVDYAEGERELRDADLLALYTDGLTDEESPAGEQVGTARLIDWIRGSRTRPIVELGDDVFGRLDAWCQGGGRADDRTLLLVSMKEAPRR